MVFKGMIASGFLQGGEDHGFGVGEVDRAGGLGEGIAIALLSDLAGGKVPLVAGLLEAVMVVGLNLGVGLGVLLKALGEDFEGFGAGGLVGGLGDLVGGPVVIGDGGGGNVAEAEAGEGGKGDVFAVLGDGGGGVPCGDIVEHLSGGAADQIAVDWVPVVDQGLVEEVVVLLAGEVEVGAGGIGMVELPGPVTIGDRFGGVGF